jgi:peptidoglycan/LPS O-acetylase OafA/YrhL
MHRSTTQRPLISALKSAAWLLTVAGLAAVLLSWLGLLGFVIYLPIAHPSDLRPFTLAVQGASCVAVFGHLTWVLVRERPRSPAQFVHVISEACLLLCITIGLLIDGGDQLGWAHGPFGYGLAGVSLVLLLAIAAYLGNRRAPSEGSPGKTRR